MSDRNYHRLECQGIRHIEYNFSVLYTAGVPGFLEGDSVGALVGSYCTLVQTGAGILTITTKDPFLAIVGVRGAIGMATPNGNTIVTQGKPVANANGTFSVTINTAVNAAGTHTATTPANGDLLYVQTRSSELRSQAVKGPSIAVMLGGKSSGDDDESSEDMSLSKAREEAENAATAFAGAVKAGDAKRIVKSFHALYELCEHVHELEESGEAEDETESKEPESDDDAAEE